MIDDKLILFFGHKSPDTDSVTSAIVCARIYERFGYVTKPVVLGDINKETKFVLNKLSIETPEEIHKIEDNQKVILVDHNEFCQSVENIENASIMAVYDHHRIDGFSTKEPLYFISEPVGCTATVMYSAFEKNGTVDIQKEEAILMLSAIISDTLLFKSPTCTKYDIQAAEKLNKIANIDIESYGLELLKAGTDLSDLPAKDLISLDAKEVKLKDKKAIIAQINTASIDDSMKRKQQIEEEIKKVIEEKKLDIFVFVITDIINSNSQIIVFGESASIVNTAFDVELVDNTAFVEGLVSRKKQIIPPLTDNA